jgi:phage gp36-like protein
MYVVFMATLCLIYYLATYTLCQFKVSDAERQWLRLVDYGELERGVDSKGEDTTPFVRC